MELIDYVKEIREFFNKEYKDKELVIRMALEIYICFSDSWFF